MNGIIYFDHAATSYPKPQSVIKAMNAAMIERGGNPGRSSHKLSMLAAEGIYKCREAVSELFNFSMPERVVFTQNTTYALNMAIKGLAQPSSHILMSNLEHNSVVRPVYSLSQKENMRISFSTFDATNEDEEELFLEFKSKIRNNTKIVVVTIASNIFGKILPIAKIGKYCKENNIICIADGAQAGGIVPLDFNELNIDVLCLPGHKGLLGPQGTGLMLCGDGIEPSSLVEGGNGINSYEPSMDGELPERLEAGTLNTPGICGLCAGIKYVMKQDIQEIYEETSYLSKYLELGLKEIDGVKVYGDYLVKTPVVLFNKEGFEPEEIASELNRNGICVRSGLHCAPSAHNAIGTGKTGAVRASLSHQNTKSEADKFLKVISNLSK